MRMLNNIYGNWYINIINTMIPVLIFSYFFFVIHRMLQKSLLIFFSVAFLAVTASQESKCGAADVVKTETLLETAAELLDKMRDNLEQGMDLLLNLFLTQ